MTVAEDGRGALTREVGSGAFLHLFSEKFLQVMSSDVFSCL